LGLDKILGAQKEDNKQVMGVPKFDANLAWAEETSPILISPIGVQNTENYLQNSGRIIVHDAETTQEDNSSTPLGPSKILGKTNIAEIIKDAKHDAEKALREAKQAIRPPKTCPKRSILKDINKVNKYPIEPKNKSERSANNENCPKRIKISGAENLPSQSSNKHLLPKKSQCTKSKKYAAPLKGQMKMTSFLRM
jgi:hypothetical protein